jgi:outer membrane receptor protein involved in Fe transport
VADSKEASMRFPPRSIGRALVALACAFLPAIAPAQTTTGTIEGKVEGQDGGTLPGVTVTLSGPGLIGSRVAATGAEGDYRLSLLPPGDYRLSFELEGFGTQEVSAGVSLGRTTTVNVTLSPAVADEITVTSAAAVIDTASTTLGANLDSRAIETLPSGRNYSSVVQIAPGTSSDANPENGSQGTLTVYGSTGAENSYLIDGVNTTGVEYGFQGKELNFEFIEAIDVKTGGYEAEFGRSTGGIVNVVTKSGGNEFHGDVFGYRDDDGLQSEADAVVGNAGTVQGFTRQDYGIGLGGFLWRDKIWFFAAYDKVSNSSDSSLAAGPRAGQIASTQSDRDLGASKLTFNLAEGKSLILNFFQDPREDTGAISDANHSLNGDPTTYEGLLEFGGRDLALRYEGVHGESWLISAQIARHEEENSVGPATEAGDAIQYRNVGADFYQTGGFGLIQEKEFEREFYGASVTRYLDRHELKAGLEFETQDATVVRRMSGGQQVDVYPNLANPARPVYRHFYWTTPTATVGNAPISQLQASPSHDNTTVYLQDRWRLRDNLTLTLGVRWDRQEIIDAAGTKQIDLKDDYAPRLGFIWDPNGDAKSRLFGSFGRFYEQLPMDLVVRSYSFERQPRIFNFDPVSNVPDPLAEAAVGTESAVLGGFTTPSDPDLRNQYISELILGYERELAPNIALGIKGIFREYGEVIEDGLCVDDGTYCIGNPGKGLLARTFTLDYSQSFPTIEPEREYRGVQVDVTKRFSDNWQGLASYLYSKLEGNFDGLYAPFTNIGADPNITAAYDYYDFFTDGRDLSRITNDGPLSNDRRHQVKLSGIYMADFGLQVGLAAYWRSGTPLTRYGFSDAYGRYEFFLSPRGAEGRTPDNYELDLHLGYPWKVGEVEINFLLDIFNLLDVQRPILLDQRYGFQESDNFLPAPANPGYLDPVLRTPPRTLRLGLRISF